MLNHKPACLLPETGTHCEHSCGWQHRCAAGQSASLRHDAHSSLANTGGHVGVCPLSWYERKVLISAIHKWLMRYGLDTRFQQLVFATVESNLLTDDVWLTGVVVVTEISRATAILEFQTHNFQCTAVHSRPSNEIDSSYLRIHRRQSSHIHRSSCWMHKRESMLDRSLPLSVDDRGWIQTRIQQCSTQIL